MQPETELAPVAVAGPREWIRDTHQTVRIPADWLLADGRIVYATNFAGCSNACSKLGLSIVEIVAWRPAYTKP